MSMAIKDQAKLVGIALAAGLALAAFGTGTALAGSANQCFAAGGIDYVQDGPNSQCIYPEEQVANPNASPNNNSQTTQDTDSGQGTFKNKTVETCEGPPGQCK